MTTTVAREQQTLVETTGVLPTDLADRARSRIGIVLAGIASAVPARLRFTRLTHSGLVRPIVAELNVELRGRLLRTQVSGATVDDAIEALAVRAGRRIAVARGRGRWPDDAGSDGRWGHRPEHLLLPPWERWLVKEKKIRPDVLPATAAAVAAEWLDVDEHLFIEATTGRAALLRRIGIAGYGCEVDAPDELMVPEPGVKVRHLVVPRLLTSEAVATLGRSGRRSLFFVDPATADGRLLYIRYDGQYSLVTG